MLPQNCRRSFIARSYSSRSISPRANRFWRISCGDSLGGSDFLIARTARTIAKLTTTKTTPQKSHIPQEAVIGIAYAVASAATILAMSRATSESEHLREILVGNILAVSWEEVLWTGLLYAVIGAFHYAFRRPFLAISMDPARAEAEGRSVRFWDFLFYASFGLVVTRSVAIAGVLLVFCYLIVPSVGAMLYAERIGPRLAIGWTMGTVVSALGIYLSVVLDLPTGATMVCTFGLVLVLMGIARLVLNPQKAVAG